MLDHSSGCGETVLGVHGDWTNIVATIGKLLLRTWDNHGSCCRWLSIKLSFNHRVDLGTKSVQSEWLGQHVHPWLEVICNRHRDFDIFNSPNCVIGRMDRSSSSKRSR